MRLIALPPITQRFELRDPKRIVDAFASGGAASQQAGRLFGEARECTGPIVLRFDWGGEEK